MEELFKKFKKGDEEAFMEIMKMYKDDVFRYMYFLFGNKETAEELTQETFVKVYFKAKTFKTNNIKNWIFAIGRNIARKEFKKMKIRKLISFSEIKGENKSISEQNDNKILIYELLKDIPEKYKTPLLMKEIEGLSLDNIAEILKKPVGTIKSYIFRGKELLKNKYKFMMEVRNDRS